MTGAAPDLLALARRRWPEWFGRKASALRLVVLDESRSHADRALAFVFDGSARQPAVALKLGRSESEARYVAHEAESLAALRPSLPADLAVSMPQALALERDGSQAVSALTVVAGGRVADPFAARRRHAGTAARDLRRFIREAVEWSDALASATASGPLAPSALAEVAREFSARLVRSPSERETVASFAEAVERSGEAIVGCWQHGDLSFRNTLRHRGRLRFLDWEHAACGVEPWLDSATLVRNVYLASMGSRALTDPRGALARFLGGAHPAGSIVRSEIVAGWQHPLPLGWAVAATWMRRALVRADEGRGAVWSWAEPALGLVADPAVRSAAGPLAPDW